MTFITIMVILNHVLTSSTNMSITRSIIRKTWCPRRFPMILVDINNGCRVRIFRYL